MQFARLRCSTLIIGVEAFIRLPQGAPLKTGQGLKGLHRRLQLLLGLILILLGVLDALHQDVALLFSQRAHRLVVSGFAAG
jgi:hypothetical protein